MFFECNTRWTPNLPNSLAVVRCILFYIKVILVFFLCVYICSGVQTYQCMCLHIYACVCTYACVCVQMHVKARGQCQIFFSTLFWALELTSMARLAEQQVPNLSLPSTGVADICQHAQLSLWVPGFLTQDFVLLRQCLCHSTLQKSC